MISRALFTFLFVLPTILWGQSPKVIYVDSAAVGFDIYHDGTSWKTAFFDLQDAIAIADSGDQIWIAKGTYFPTSCDNCDSEDRDVSFQVPQFVNLIGGFIGDEASIPDRRMDSMSLFHSNATILSGNIGLDGRVDDNSKVILQFNTRYKDGPPTYLDGLIIEGGYIKEDFQSLGLGTINIPIGIDLEFRNCLFINNENYSEGIINFDGSLEIIEKLVFQGCYFNNNLARAIFFVDYSGISINGCKFNNNKEEIFNIFNDDDELEEITYTQINNCTFINNESIGYFRGPTDLWISNSVIENTTKDGLEFEYIRGGRIDSTHFINIGGEAISYLSHLSFLEGDFPIEGIFEDVDTLKLSNCKFIDSDSLAINFNYGRLELISTKFNNSRVETRNTDFFGINCMFQNINKPFAKAGAFGGAMECIDSNSEIISSTFKKNQIEGSYSLIGHAIIPSGGGGAIYNKNGNHFYSNCTFEENITSGKGGGAIFSDESDVIIQDSYFFKNRANGLDMDLEFLPGNGGAIYCTNGNTLVENSTIENNFASGIGGGFWLGITNEGIFNQNRIEKCNTFSNNSHSFGGGGYLAGPSTVTDCHFSKNSAEGGGALTVNGHISMLGSTISDNHANRSGGGILSSGKLELINSTIYNNNSTDGGGIFCDKHRPFFNDTETSLDLLSIRYSTIYSNNSNSDGKNIQVNFGDTLFLKNSIVAGDGPIISASEGSFVLSEGHNLISDTTASNFKARFTDIVGSSLESINPRLDTLKMNGGPVPTLALLANSPSISSGEFLDSTSITVDQRGYSRIFGSKNSRIDIGAYEYQETNVSAPEIQVCQLDNESIVLGSIKLTDSTGGGWAIGENQSIVLRFPNEIFIQENSSTEVVALGEGIIIEGYEIEAEKIEITYTRNYTSEPNQIIIENLVINVNLAPGIYSLLRTHEGNSIQYGNSPQDSISHASIWVLPTITSENLPYDDSFESESTIWQPHENNSLWELGIPTGSKIDSASDGEKVWATDLDSAYSANVHTWLYSPCFDLDSLSYPMVSFDLWSDTETALDGTVLQVSTDNGNNWRTFGSDTTGINWYDFAALNANPGNQPQESQFGWSGEYSRWKTTSHRLVDSLRSPITRFRMAFRSINFVNPIDDFNGVAIDNFFLGDRSRKILLEYFPGADSPELFMIKPELFDQYGEDIIPINFHFQTGDPLQPSNSIDPQARLSHYGISTPGNLIVGGIEYQGLADLLSMRTIDTSSLEFSPFHISIYTTNGDPFTVVSKITALQKWERPIRVYIALLENGVVAEDRIYNYVLRKLLPGAQGLSYGNLEEFESIPIQETWDFNSQPSPSIVQNPDSLYAVVFIQDEETQEIYQACRAGMGRELSVSNEAPIAEGIYIYPNPVRDKVFIQIDRIYPQNRLILRNLNGQLVRTLTLPENEALKEWSLSNIPTGVYVLEIYINNEIVKREKIVISY